MCSCQNSTMFCHRSALILRKNPLLLFFPCQGLRRNVKFRCVLDQIVPKFTVSSSLSSVLTSGNAIAAAAAVSGGSVHGAVTSAITQVAVTAVAIASGACLSTKVDFLWPKVDEQPGSLLLDGVDVTGYPIFNDDKVQKAIAFARKAHNGQLRRTGEPYLTHCIHTGKIVAVLVPSTGKRAIDTVVAGILHDVVDDTGESLDTIEREFDSDVANLVAGVSRLSFINQLLRRHRRLNVNQAALSHDEANNLRVMLLGMVDDPRVVLIKLADRLHNMRTIYALPPAKAQAVAQETLAIWCSLASRLGLWALKAELEDLCFAVLQPQIFLRMRADLASMWSHPNRTGNARKIYGKFSSLLHQRMKRVTTEHEEPSETDEENICMKVLLQAVLPFDLLQDRKKRTDFFNKLVANSNLETTPKVVRDAAFALGTLVVCEEALERELFISTSYVPGMEVTLSGRLKSLFSIYSKMKRKEIGINKVYDARALRVIVGDKNGALHSQAVQSCYNLLNIVHRLWSPIDGEFDDYIVNPKSSGYQSLHTAVQGPDNSPLEIQIRTQRMHECAEHGLAAHWLYKETKDKLPLVTSVTGSGTTTPSFFSTDIDDQGSIEDDGSHKYSSLKVSWLNKLGFGARTDTPMDSSSSAIPQGPDTDIPAPGQQFVQFGAGCFWGVELAFQRVPGVTKTEVGYSQGYLDNPTYEDICSGNTFHSEVVRVQYDPKECNFDTLLDVFWDRHDPTTLNRQGNDVGTQYRSGIYFYTPEQEKAALEARDRQQKILNRNIVTEILPAKKFYRAEEYHQQYLAKGGRFGFRQSVEKGCNDPIRCYG